MVRIALRLLIALALILQGGIGATAAFASGGHHCHASMSHAGHASKCPCCPAKSSMSCADFCMTVAALPSIAAAFEPPVLSMSTPIESARPVVSPIDTPLRPPIV